MTEEAAKAPPVNPEIDAALRELLRNAKKRVKEDAAGAQKELLEVLSVAIKWEAIKLKNRDRDWGSAFDAEEEDDD